MRARSCALKRSGSGEGGTARGQWERAPARLNERAIPSNLGRSVGAAKLKDYVFFRIACAKLSREHAILGRLGFVFELEGAEEFVLHPRHRLAIRIGTFNR